MSKRNRFHFAITGGRYAAAEHQRQEREAEQKAARMMAMSTLLEQPPVERARCAAGLITSLFGDLPAELKVSGETCWREPHALEEKLTKISQRPAAVPAGHQLDASPTPAGGDCSSNIPPAVFS
jgi:hypothetical protein